MTRPGGPTSPARSVSPEQLVSRFAESIGRPAEARLYLELFRAESGARFAIIAPGPLEAPAADALVADLGYLAALGLFPLVWGAPADLAERAGDAGLPIAEVETPDAALDAARASRIPWAPRVPGLPEWAAALGSHKVVLLDGAIRGRGGEVISLLDVGAELDALLAPGRLDPEHRVRLERAAELEAALLVCSAAATVALTSPFDLLRELFTVRGAGTMIRRGAAIRTLQPTDPEIATVLGPLLESAFGRPVHPGFFARPIERIYLAGAEPAGAAVIEPAEPAPYLSKFAVGPAARGAGIGRDLWRAIAADFPRLYWRARADNSITSWYLRQADGFFRAGAWNVFWIGLEPGELGAAIARATDRPEDFGRQVGARASDRRAPGDGELPG